MAERREADAASATGVARSATGAAELAALRDRIERLYEDPPDAADPEHYELLARFRRALDGGEARAAEPDPGSPWGWRGDRDLAKTEA